nr:tRNA cytidylyltransferase [Bacillota bacterium]
MGSVASVEIPVPPPVRWICDVLRGSGYQAFVVGGGVRDALLGRPVHDWDVATDAPPDAVQRLFPRTVPTGIEFGTVTVIIDSQAVQVTTFRSEGGYRDARHPGWVTFGQRIEDDLKRRDLTVNALAYDPASGRFVDPYGGQADLANRIIRTVGHPVERFQEDALRLMRAVRLAAELGFRLDGRTAAGIRCCAPRLERVSRERVGEEWRRLLAAPDAGRGLMLLYRTRLLPWVLPGAPKLERVAVRRTVAALERLAASGAATKMAAVLYGLSSPEADAALLRSLVYSRQASRQVSHLAQCLRDFRRDAVHSDAALRRFLARVGREHVPPFLELWRAWQPLESHRLGRELDRWAERVLAAGAALSPGELAVDGTDIQQAGGVPPGPQVGALLTRLWEHVLEHPEDNTRDRLLTLIKAWATEQRCSG